MHPFIDDVPLFRLAESEDCSERAVKYIASIFDYARCVMSFQVDLALVRARTSSDELNVYQKEAEAIDASRTLKHDRAISSLKILNRMAEQAGLSPIYRGDIDLDDRKDVTHAVIRFATILLNFEDADTGWQKRGDAWLKDGQAQ